MNERVRDYVRLRWPRLLRLYQRRVAPHVHRGRPYHEVSAWAEQGMRLVARTGMGGVRFERDRVWVADAGGTWWRYTPWSFGSALGAELGIVYEHAEIELLAARLSPGAVLVDIGANVGSYAIRLARAIEGLRVLAFEAVGPTYATLLENAAENGVADRVEARHLALSDHEGVLRMTVGFQAANFAVPDGQAAATEIETVPCRPLDAVLADAGRVDAIKCDVEGAELAVLRGATETLSRHRPLVLVEIDDRWARRYGHGGADVVRFLGELGYAYERMVGDELRPPGESVAADLAEGRNFLFSPRT